MGGYRYGFNGKEKLDEVEGDGNIYDYGFRIYNPRIEKFLSTDPLTNSYPWYTPYQFAGNMPIWAVDLDGLEEKLVTNYYDDYKRKEQTVITILTNLNTGNEEDMNLVNEEGLNRAGSNNVLIRNVASNGKTTYSTATQLNKGDQQIKDKAIKELIQPKVSPFALQVGGKVGDGGEY